MPRRLSASRRNKRTYASRLPRSAKIRFSRYSGEYRTCPDHLCSIPSLTSSHVVAGFCYFMTPEKRSALAMFTEGLGTVVVPPAAVLAAAYAHDKLLVVEYAAVVAAAAFPLSSSWLGQRIRSGSRRDAALRVAVEALVRNVLKTPSSGDPQTPVLRVTAFVPQKSSKGEALLPLLRVDSNPRSRVLNYGEEGFRSTERFRRGDAFAGQTWDDLGERYETFPSMYDYPGTDEERRRAWVDAWQQRGAQNPLAWGDYMRKVRSLWTFAVPGSEEGGGALAVVSIDSTESHAFSVAEERGAVAVPSSSFFDGLNLREAIAAGIGAAVLAGMGEPRGLFRRLRSALKRSRATPPAAHAT